MPADFLSYSIGKITIGKPYYVLNGVGHPRWIPQPNVSWLSGTASHQGRQRFQAPVPSWRKRRCSLQPALSVTRPTGSADTSFQAKCRWGALWWLTAGCEGHYGNRGVVCQGLVNNKDQRTPAQGCVRLANQTKPFHLGNSLLNMLCVVLWGV